MYDVSESMVALLTKQGMRAGSVGAETVHGMKEAGSARHVNAARQVARWEEKSGIRLAWVNTALNLRAGKRAHTLKVVK